MRITKRPFIYSTLLIVVAVITGEIFARYYLGLGDPPLSVKHPTIEYMYKPNQDVYRFGNHFIVNQYGMRTVPFAQQKGNGASRIMVFGDSVINGGNLTDHSDLATSLIQEGLADAGYKHPIVGNISAGSWGPGNWLAYAKEYGFFDSDIVVLVISSHDYADNPTFQPLNRNTHPTEKPVSALLEGIERYLPRYFPQFGINQNTGETDHPSEEVNERGAQKGIDDLKSFLELAKQRSKTVLVLQHLEKSELDKHAPIVGYHRIMVACKQLNISPISLEPYFRWSIERGKNPYRDNVHPNKVGQQLIAEAIIANLPIRRSSGPR